MSNVTSYETVLTALIVDDAVATLLKLHVKSMLYCLPTTLPPTVGLPIETVLLSVNLSSSELKPNDDPHSEKPVLIFQKSVFSESSTAVQGSIKLIADESTPGTAHLAILISAPAEEQVTVAFPDSN
jgi:hypothetical protein